MPELLDRLPSSVKILHVLDHSVPLHSGYTFRTLAILRQQRALGWETFHLTSPKHHVARADEEESDGLHFFRTRVASGGWRSLPVLDPLSVIAATQRRAAEVIARVRPDVVHAHSPCLNGIAALRAARAHGVPLVYEVRAFWEDAAVDHGTTTEGSLRYRVSRQLETWLLKRADAVTTICEGLRDDIFGRGLPTSRVTVIPNAVDPEEFPVIDAPDRELRAKLGLEDCLTIGFIGSFYGYEGLDILVEALPALLALDGRTRLLLVGGGVGEQPLKERVRALGVADKVIFTGRVPHADVARYYSLIDLLAYPRKSMRLTETVTPLKPLEAMAQGRLLLASNVGGHRELVRDGETGFLFAPGRPEPLVQAVQRALASRGSWPAMRAAGRKFVESERNWRASVARYRGVYEPLTQRPAHA